MSMTIYDLTCDHCENGMSVDDAYNVEYTDGMANVLCEKCVEWAENNWNVAYVWQ